MALYACNLTGAAVTLAAGKRTVVLPAKVGALTYGAPVNVTSELEGLSGANYTALEAQRPATVAYVWDNGIPDYAVGTLTVTKTFASIDNATLLAPTLLDFSMMPATSSVPKFFTSRTMLRPTLKNPGAVSTIVSGV